MLFILRLAPFCLVFCTKNAVHLAPKRSAFCTKTQCILHQNTVYFAPKRSVFSGKTPETGCKQRSF